MTALRQQRLSRLVGAISLALAITVIAPLGMPVNPVRANTSVALPTFKVGEQEVDDLKAVFATVRSKDRVEARVRTPGTVASLKVTEGDHVTPGQVLAVVVDPKIALKLKALDAQSIAAQSRLDAAQSDFERAEQLKDRGVVSQSRYDQLKAAFEVATNDLKALQAERAVTERQGVEGEVLAPAAGRVLRVPVTEGSVMLQGESVATIAANEYILRLELPERHARVMQKGAVVKAGARGLTPEEGGLRQGHITKVFPELDNGRVVADAVIADLGDYFVGERTLVWISAGKRKTIVVPARFVFQRFGLDYVRVKHGEGTIDVVVQLGRPVPAGEEPAGMSGDKKDAVAAVEVLAGLKAGDELVQP